MYVTVFVWQTSVLIQREDLYLESAMGHLLKQWPYRREPGNSNSIVVQRAYWLAVSKVLIGSSGRQ